MIDDLKRIISELGAIVARLDGADPAPGYERKPLPPGAQNAYFGAGALWRAADTARRSGQPDAPAFDMFEYIGGIQQGGGVRIPPKSPEQMTEDILALGLSDWGQRWLSDDRNAALIDPDYQRHFLGYRVARRAQNDETQGYIRIP